MDFHQYINKIKSIQNYIKDYFVETDRNKSDFLVILENDLKISENPHDIKLILNLLSKISNNCYRSSTFFTKIFHILSYFKEIIKQNLSNYELFNIFKKNKRIILFLLEENMLSIDKSIADNMINVKYSSYRYQFYLFPEIKNFLNDKMIDEIKSKLPDDFEESRKLGENHTEISRMIRDDLIDEFILYVNKLNCSLDVKIEFSIFETNLFLIKNQTSLIEYAAFFGSIKIFKFLFKNKVELRPFLLLYAIHGGNAEMIHLLEESHIESQDKSYIKCLEESIKCHNVELIDYFINNFETIDENISSEINIMCLKYFNFQFIIENLINKSLFFELCKFDYYELVKFMLETSDIDINLIVIFIELFLYCFYFRDFIEFSIDFFLNRISNYCL